MNKALIYHMTTSAKNQVLRLKKRPLKAIGFLIAILYFMFLPLFMKTTVTDFGLDNPQGFLIILTGLNVYIMMPATLSYFKRNGIVFRKQDVNFMLASPISPKQNLFYALFKQAYLQIFMQIVGFVTALYLFRVPLINALLYSFSNLIFSSLLSYSLAMILYGSERLSENTKNLLKYIVYLIMAVVLGSIIWYLLKKGASVENIFALVQSPLVLGIPIFGWELGYANLILRGANTTTVVTSILYLLTTAILAFTAYRMQSTGAYYEDALKFSEKQAKLEKNKGNVSLGEAFGKKRKIHKVSGSINGTYAKAVFSRQLLEKKRTRRFYFSISEIIMLAVGILGGILLKNTDFEPEYFILATTGISIYFALFFNPSSLWKDEFSAYFMYVIPDSIANKIIYSTVLEHVTSLIKAVFLSVPIGILIHASVLDILYSILIQIALKAIMVYKSMFIDGYLGAKIGKTPATLVSLFASMVLMIVPLITLFASTTLSSTMTFAIIMGYSIVTTTLFIYFCHKTLTNIESLDD